MSRMPNPADIYVPDMFDTAQKAVSLKEAQLGLKARQQQLADEANAKRILGQLGPDAIDDPSSIFKLPGGSSAAKLKIFSELSDAKAAKARQEVEGLNLFHTRSEMMKQKLNEVADALSILDNHVKDGMTDEAGAQTIWSGVYPKLNQDLQDMSQRFGLPVPHQLSPDFRSHDHDTYRSGAEYLGKIQAAAKDRLAELKAQQAEEDRKKKEALEEQTKPPAITERFASRFAHIPGYDLKDPSQYSRFYDWANTKEGETKLYQFVHDRLPSFAEEVGHIPTNKEFSDEFKKYKDESADIKNPQFYDEMDERGHTIRNYFKGDPDNIISKKDLGKKTADQTVLVHTSDDQGNKITKIVPKTAGATYEGAPTAQEENRRDQAKIVSNYADHLISLLNSSPDTVGPLIGRIYRGEVQVGNAPPNVQAIHTALGSMEALMPILHGFRGGSQTVQHFHQVLGDQSTNRAALIASVNELKSLANEIRTGKAIEDDGSGGVSTTNKPSTTIAPGGAVQRLINRSKVK